MNQLFTQESVTLTKFPDSMESIIFGKSKHRYSCPICKQEVRKIVLGFERHDERKELFKHYDMLQPVCEDCFEFHVYNDLMNRMYQTNIY